MRSKESDFGQGYRPDIDGLRAVAILPVLLFHGFPQIFKGGFIGVDVFFVISGFLITKIILQDLRNGTFSVGRFYVRRIRRIFPALILVLLSTLALGWVFLLSDEFKQLGKHVVAGSSFASNLILWKEVGYFDNAAESKPLLHLWSLGIEEQFYLFWPILLLLTWSRNFRPLFSILAVVGISFTLNIRGIGSDPAGAFYFPTSRFWELACGGVVAWFDFTSKKESEDSRRWFNDVLAAFGLLLVVCSIFFVDKNRGFPGYWALWPVLGSVFIILAGPTTWINRRFLANRAVIYLGLISYPLYLWHWPFLAVLRVVKSSGPSTSEILLTLFVSVVLASLTYELIEKKVRISRPSHAQTGGLVLAMVVTAFAGYLVYATDGFPNRVNQFETNRAQLKHPPLVQNTQACKDEFPKFKGECISSVDHTHGSPFDLVFLGDSHALVLAMGLTEKSSSKDFLQIGLNGCPPLKMVDRFRFEKSYRCMEVYNEIFELIQGLKPRDSTLVITMYYSAYFTGEGFGQRRDEFIEPGSIHIQPAGKKMEGSKDLYAQTFSAGLAGLLEDYSPLFKNIVLVLQIPELAESPEKCLARPFRVASVDCKSSRTSVLTRQSGVRAVVDQLKAKYSNLKVYDPIDVFCDAEFCGPFSEQKLLYRDDNHLGMYGSKAVLEDMKRKGVID